MVGLHGWVVAAWIALPTVMYGGYALLSYLTRGGLSPFQQTMFRAGHAHAGVLLLMALLYYSFLDRTSLTFGCRQVACAILVAGILAQSGGFFINLVKGQPSFGTTVTKAGAVLLTLAITILVYGLVFAG
jgi:hypothetical protein